MTNALLLKVSIAILAAVLGIAAFLGRAEVKHEQLNRKPTAQEQKKAMEPMKHWSKSIKNY
jgi:energy-converting hydrogenase Eha subunit F